MKAAIIIGHSKNDKGAANGKHNEYDYNSEIAELVKEFAPFNVVVIYRTGLYSQVPNDVNKTKADIAISLHCNAFNKIASGTCTLSSGSNGSLALAEIIQKKMVSVFQLKNRGVVKRKRNERGGLILHETKMPCVLLEPFFIDSDLKQGLNKKREYAKAIVESILQYQLI